MSLSVNETTLLCLVAYMKVKAKDCTSLAPIVHAEWEDGTVMVLFLSEDFDEMELRAKIAHVREVQESPPSVVVLLCEALCDTAADDDHPVYDRDDPNVAAYGRGLVAFGVGHSVQDVSRLGCRYGYDDRGLVWFDDISPLSPIGDDPLVELLR